jgi:hypothetical protein
MCRSSFHHRDTVVDLGHDRLGDLAARSESGRRRFSCHACGIVEMTSDRKKPGVAFWATVVVVVVLVVYPLSLGPACWLIHRRIIPMRPTAQVYEPVLGNLHKAPHWTRDLITAGDIDMKITLVRMKQSLYVAD